MNIFRLTCTIQIPCFKTKLKISDLMFNTSIYQKPFCMYLLFFFKTEERNKIKLFKFNFIFHLLDSTIIKTDSKAKKKWIHLENIIIS